MGADQFLAHDVGAMLDSSGAQLISAVIRMVGSKDISKSRIMEQTGATS